jgi:hypothetical protein
MKIRDVLALAATVLLCLGSAARAQYMTISSLTAGAHTSSNGSFVGSLAGATVTGSATSLTTGSFTFNPTTAGSTGLSAWELSNTAGTSAQYSYSSVYASQAATAASVGYTLWAGSTNTATITLGFSKPMTNVVFQFANLDNSVWTFDNVGGVTGLSLLKGNNGADGDGIGLSGFSVVDRVTGDTGQAPTATPFTNGTNNRSAYGSVMVNGTYSSLTVRLAATHSNGGDGGNFTLAVIPEPGALALFGLGVALGALLRKRRKAR